MRASASLLLFLLVAVGSTGCGSSAPAGPYVVVSPATSRYPSSSGSVSTGPVATLSQTGTPPSLDCPVALALDNSGELFVANAGTQGAGGTLSWFTAVDMATGGPATPLLQLTNIAVTMGGLAFNPTPANLPLRH